MDDVARHALAQVNTISAPNHLAPEEVVNAIEPLNCTDAKEWSCFTQEVTDLSPYNRL